MARNLALRILRGLKANIPSLFAGEAFWTSDTNDLYIGTGTTNSLLTIPVFDISGNRINQPHIVIGLVVLGGGGNITVTLTSSMAFSSATSYATTVSCKNAKRALQINQLSGTQFTIMGSGGDNVYFQCIGN